MGVNLRDPWWWIRHGVYVGVVVGVFFGVVEGWKALALPTDMALFIIAYLVAFKIVAPRVETALGLNYTDTEDDDE